MSHIRDGFDRGFALARLAKQAKTQGDKRAAFTLLKQAIGVFMDLFPTIPDNRTQKMVAAVRRGTGVLREVGVVIREESSPPPTGRSWVHTSPSLR